MISAKLDSFYQSLRAREMETLLDHDHDAVGPTPTSVALCTCAIAGGIAGYPLTLCYRDFPPELMTDLWKYHLAETACGAFVVVETAKDLEAARQRLGDLRLLLVYNPRLIARAVRTIAFYEAAEATTKSRPTIFAEWQAADLDELPGAVLVLNGRHDEIASLTEWLANERSPSEKAKELKPPNNIAFDAAIQPLLSPGTADDGHSLSMRDCKLLKSLLVGAAIIDSKSTDLQSIDVSLETYERVRQMLLSPVTQSADVEVDAITLMMTNRAKVMLKMGALDNANPSMTRNQIAELGNVKSGTVRSLVEFVRRQPDGLQQFLRLGVRRRPHCEETFGREDCAALALRLEPWTLKQVRSRFDRLRKEGLIEAGKDRKSGAWSYEIPDVLPARRSPFGLLPSANKLRGAAIDVSGAPGACPTCPSPAQALGQTKPAK